MRKLPAGGVASITAVLGKGVLKPTAALRKRRQLAFKARMIDVKQRRFNLVRGVRAR